MFWKSHCISLGSDCEALGKAFLYSPAVAVRRMLRRSSKDVTNMHRKMTANLHLVHRCAIIFILNYALLCYAPPTLHLFAQHTYLFCRSLAVFTSLEQGVVASYFLFAFRLMQFTCIESRRVRSSIS